jgi:hypothetical protein
MAHIHVSKEYVVKVSGTYETFEEAKKELLEVDDLLTSEDIENVRDWQDLAHVLVEESHIGNYEGVVVEVASNDWACDDKSHEEVQDFAWFEYEA